MQTDAGTSLLVVLDMAIMDKVFCRVFYGLATKSVLAGHHVADETLMNSQLNAAPHR
jgi:hypothetical protein